MTNKIAKTFLSMMVGVTAPMLTSIQQASADEAGTITVVNCGFDQVPEPNEVLVFSDYNFSGECWRLSVNNPGNPLEGSLPYVGWSKPISIWNDSLSSAVIGSNVEYVEFYWDGGPANKAWGIYGNGAAGCFLFEGFNGVWYRGDTGFGGTEQNENGIWSEPCVKWFDNKASALVIRLKS